MDKVRCRDCKHFVEGFGWTPTDKCFLPTGKWDPVYGLGKAGVRWVPAREKNEHGTCPDFEDRERRWQLLFWLLFGGALVFVVALGS